MNQSKILEHIKNYNLKNEEKRLKNEASFRRVDDVYEIESIHSLSTVDEDFRYGKKPSEDIEDFIHETFAKFKEDNPVANREMKKYPYYDFSKSCLDIVLIKYHRVVNGEKENNPRWQVMYLFGKDSEGNDIYFYSSEYAWKETIPNLFCPREALDTLPTQIVEYLKENSILEKVSVLAKDLNSEFLDYIDFYYEEIVHDNMYENFFVNLLNSNNLTEISEDNPWKKYEGLSTEEFVVANFESIKEELPLFTTMATLVQEICFVQVYNEVLKRNYWFTIYYFGDNEDGEPRYLIGGEPEENSPTNKNLKENGWEEFPDDIRKFWKIHGVFLSYLNYGAEEFHIRHLSKFYIESQDYGAIPHYSKVNFLASELDHYMLKWDRPEDICFNIDLPSSYDSEAENWEECDEAFQTFVQEYLKHAILLGSDNGDEIFILKSFNSLPQYFRMAHGGDWSYFYDSFWDLLGREIEEELSLNE